MSKVTIRNDCTVELDSVEGTDAKLARMARVSTQDRDLLMKQNSEAADAGLINYLMKNRHGCYDDQTEVLTRTGWKPWPEVDGTEEFLTVNRVTGKQEYQKPVAVIHKPWDGEMVRLTGASLDLLVTPDHKMLAAPRVHADVPEWGMHDAAELHNRSYRLPLGFGSWVGERHIDPNRLRLLGFFIGDGSSNGSIEFHLRRARKIAYLLETSHACGFSVFANGDRYRLHADEDFRLLVKKCYGDQREKVIPAEVLECDPKGLEALLGGLMASDGHVSRTGRQTYTTTSPVLRDQIQEVAAKLGRAATWRAQDAAEGHFGLKPVFQMTLYRDRNLHQRVGWTRADRARQVVREHYKGMVHCVTVPNGVLYVRRNGIPLWCGNSPFEHGLLTFYIEAPIKVFREFHRHRVGFCLAGDTEVWTESIAPRSGRTIRKRPISELYNNWHNGVRDITGRVRKLPSCRNISVRTLEESTGRFILSRVVDIYENGTKPVRKLTTEMGHTLKASEDHLIWTPEGWRKLGELGIGDVIGRNGRVSTARGRQCPPSLRRGIGVWTSMQRTSLIKPIDTCYLCGGRYNFDDLTLDHKIPVVTDLTKALDVTNLAPACLRCHRDKTDREQALALRGQTAGVAWTTITSIEDAGEEITYDLELEGPNRGFVANGLVVHNSYNETSGRYRELEPVFYVPPPSRPLVQVGKPGAYTFTQGTEEQYWRQLDRAVRGAQVDWELYQDALADGIAREVARDVLGVNLYSYMFVTCNPRSLMHFLSLRTCEPGAKFPSFPMWEIEQVARKMEESFATAYPITYRAFCEHGRVAP